MRGYYGNARTRARAIVGAALADERLPSARDNAKVAAVVVLSAIAAVAAGRVLSTRLGR